MENKIRVGGKDAIDPKTGLIMYREYTTFEANRKAQFIKVFYNQWLESNDIRLEEKNGRSYLVVDINELSHIEDGDASADPPLEPKKVIDSPAYPMFTGWFNKIVPNDWVGAKFGADIIVGYINQTLAEMPFDVGDEYKVKPI